MIEGPLRFQPFNKLRRRPVSCTCANRAMKRAASTYCLRKFIFVWNICAILILRQSAIRIVIGCFNCFWRCGQRFTGAVDSTAKFHNTFSCKACVFHRNCTGNLFSTISSSFRTGRSGFSSSFALRCCRRTACRLCCFRGCRRGAALRC